MSPLVGSRWELNVYYTVLWMCCAVCVLCARAFVHCVCVRAYTSCWLDLTIEQQRLLIESKWGSYTRRASIDFRRDTSYFRYCAGGRNKIVLFLFFFFYVLLFYFRFEMWYRRHPHAHPCPNNSKHSGLASPRLAFFDKNLTVWPWWICLVAQRTFF